MTPEQELHLQGIKDSFVRSVDEKYRAGQKEHGGDLSKKSVIELLNDALEECLDNYVYLKTARDNYVIYLNNNRRD